MTGIRTTVIVVYIPILDKRTIGFLERQRGLHHMMWVLDPQLVGECFPSVDTQEVIRPEYVVGAIKSQNLFGHVKIANKHMFKFLHQPRVHIIMPDNLLHRATANRYFPSHEVIFYPLG